MVSTLLVTKRYNAHPTPNLVAQPSLTQRLDDGLRDDNCPFLVVASAGNGSLCHLFGTAPTHASYRTAILE